MPQTDSPPRYDRGEVEARIEPALGLLYEAREFAREFAVDYWQFAVELDCLLNLALTVNDCRWLFHRGYVEHAVETSLAGQAQRAFQVTGAAQFTATSCFVLTEAGASYVEENGEPVRRHEQKPTWDRQRHELSLGGVLVKRFRTPAGNQEAILDAFQEEGWPHRIDDPLPPKQGQDSKRRVHDTINSLNRNQRQTLLRFFGDGTGQGICWERIE